MSLIGGLFSLAANLTHQASLSLVLVLSDAALVLVLVPIAANPIGLSVSLKASRTSTASLSTGTASLSKVGCMITMGRTNQASVPDSAGRNVHSPIDATGTR
jgi:hypothetical protein